ncbi:MAG: hypothetical protein IT324_27475, partial [Anaerolineae bacterium]|nr:hypothetical protein [Anaerolineae bacterium]
MLKRKSLLSLLVTCAVQAAIVFSNGAIAVQAQNQLTVGYVLVGPKEDKGWSEAHYRAIQ